MQTARDLQPGGRSVEDFDANELGRAGLSAFFNVADCWGLSADDQRIVLGAPPRSTFYAWRKTKAARLSADTLERISYILGIYKALHILLPQADAADGWVRRCNNAPLFNGRSALDYMRGGRVVDLADVRRYLDGERGL